MGEKIGIVDVGGGFRGIYCAGVLDYCMDQGIQFDLAIGVSAGSANMASFCAKQPRRNYKFYTEYGLRTEYMSLWNYFHKRSYINLPYVYGTLTNSDGEYPIDYETMMANPMAFWTVATDAQTGLPRYFPKEYHPKDDYRALMASSAIPGVCRPIELEGRPYYDGALGDPVPIEKAFALGCDRVILMLTLPEDFVRNPERDTKAARRIQKEFPKAAEALMNRAKLYNDSVAAAKNYAKEGKLIIVAPDDTCGVRTLCRDTDNLKALYQKGYGDGKKIAQFLAQK